MTRAKRFRVALSFPGERRDFVSQVADQLAAVIGREAVLYDKYYEPEFARPNLDTYLQRLYHDESELLAVFLCEEYERKEWCGLEWRAIRDLIKQRHDDAVMPLRFDNTEIPGLFSGDGYIWIPDRSPGEIAQLILTRLGMMSKWVRGSSAPNPDQIVASFQGPTSRLTRLCVKPDQWIPRAEEEQLSQFVDSGRSGVLCLLGGPGSGKTALLATLAVDTAAKGHATLAVKADLIPADERFDSWIQKQLGLGLGALDSIKSLVSALLESMLRLGLDDAFAILHDIDIRPVAVRRREPIQRRRRRRAGR